MKKSQPTEEPADGPVLLRHDSEFSVSSHYEYSDGSPQLNMWQGGILLCADCLGTGLLALPQDIHVLGYALGLGFLIANLPINLFAGTILSHTATAVETRQKVLNRLYQENLSHAAAAGGGLEDEVIDFREMNANTVESEITLPGANNNNNNNNNNNDTVNSQLSAFFQPRVVDYGAINMDTFKSNVTFVTTGTTHTQLHHDTATFDFIGMTRALFKSKTATKLVIAIYYINIFLVLGNYILVMSHAVSAAFGGDMCYPTAGLVASIGMFVVSQSRTMAKLGRSASILSLTALLIVVAQCLWAAQTHQAVVDDSEPAEFGILRKLSAFGSIGFAVGSQKLFLNIRHELSDRSVAPKSLALALTVFGTFYVLIVLIAGPNPPGFLFDAIPPGANRRIAGILLWAHVVVSYAINSQAICSSMDRLVWHRLNIPGSGDPALRWMSLTFLMAIAAYSVANAIPFFKDLVALIGALTSVPLTLLLPALFWRKHLHVPLWKPTSDSMYSYALVIFASVFMVTATIGSVYSIQQDWASHGGPFACH